VREGDLGKPGRLSFVHSIRDLLREVRERPGLWLGSKTLTGLKCLLMGYDIACSKHNVSKSDRLPDNVPWRGFTEWLQVRYDKVDWVVDWRWLLVEHSQSEAEAFDRFFELLAEYEAAVSTSRLCGPTGDDRLGKDHGDG
jgi:hypothetical protein